MTSFFATLNTNAATVDWGIPQTITTAAADVETEGVLVYAIDASRSGDGTSSITVTGENGAEVVFQSYDPVNAEGILGFSSKFRNSANFGGGSSDYGGIVDDGFWQGAESIDGETPAFATDSIVLNQLIVGQEYLIQYWVQDAARNPTFLTVLDGSTSLTLDTDDPDYPDSGQFVVGTFTADAETQSISVSGRINGTNNYGRTHLNAIQLRRFSEPFIEWQPSVDLYSGSTTENFVNDWSTTSVLAYNATTTDGAADNPTISLNNVEFTSIDSATLNAGYTDANSGLSIQAATSSESVTAFQDGGFNGNPDIYNVIASGHWALNTFTISGLSPGTNYQIQAFTNDARSSRNSGFKVGFGDGSLSHADSITAGTAGLAELNNGDDADRSGDSIVGTFTATAGTQTFSIRGTGDGGATWNNGSQAQINALQIAVVEEPGVTPTLTLTVGHTPQQQMRYGIDYERLWFWQGSASVRDRFAEWSVADCDVDYVRVAINSKYELTEGVLQEDAYFDNDDNEGGGSNNDRIIPMMQDMKAANPDIKFFASPRPLNEAVSGVAWQPYPQWITGSSGNNSNFSFDEVKCSEYLLRYLILMKQYGFQISYMDLTNEWNFVTGTDYRDISALFDDYVDAPANAKPVVHPDYPTVTLTAEDIPELVGASAWSYTQGRSWMNGLTSRLRREAVDIASSHNTDKGGTAQDVTDRVEEIYAGDGYVPEIWNTEVHGWKSTSNADEVLTYAYMMECINAGFSGLSGWLAVGFSNQGHCYIVNNQRSVKYYMFQKLTNTSNRGYALEVNEPDEFKVYWDSDPDQADADSAVSALIRGNLMTVWVLNHSDTDYPITINPTGRTISDDPIKVTRWSQIDGVSVEGETQTLQAETDTSVLAVAQDNSAYCFEILLEPEVGNYARIQAEGYDSSGPASHPTEATTDAGAGLNLSNINDGNWTSYEDVDLSEATNIRFRIATPSGNPDSEIEIRTGSQTGPVIGHTAIPATGDWQEWLTIETPLDATSGTHDLYLVYTEAGSNQNGSGAMFNLNWFEIVSDGPPTEAPTNLTEEPLSNGTTIRLTWDAVPDSIGYTVKRSTSPGGPYSIVSDTVTSNAFVDAGLTTGTPYYYVIVTRYSGGFESADSATIEAVLSNPTEAPTNLTEEPLSNGTTIRLTWDTVPDAIGYAVKRSTSPGGPYSIVSDTVTSSAFVNTGLTTGTPYYYVIITRYSGGFESEESAEIEAVPSNPTVAPTNLTEEPFINGTTVRVTWDAVPDAIGYTVKRSTTQGGPYSVVNDTATGTIFIDTGLTLGTPYYYVIVTRYSGGFESADSAAIEAVPSNPLSPESLVFGQISIGNNGNSFLFSIMNSELGHMYQAQGSSSLELGDWGNVGAEKAGNGGVLDFVMPISQTNTKNFYRAVIRQQ
ncbi:MAG: carbohydrate-binding protein [Akkermansiaceae bacterium]